MRYFPLFLDLADGAVLIVGGGPEALNKARLLAKTQAHLAIVAPALEPELAAMVERGRARWVARSFDSKLLEGVNVVFGADRELNAEVAAAARARNIPVNVVDAPELSSFLTPSIVDRDPVVIAVGTEGTAPVLGQGIRAKIEAMLPEGLGRLAKAAGELRAKVAAAVPPGGRRRSFWTHYFFGPIREAFLAGDGRTYAHELETALAGHSSPPAGRVSLVGAGPGDPELLTLKAHRKLQEADVIVYDRLVGEGVLELARRDARRIPVGKTPFETSPRQSDINAILIREAKSGRHVVRLKGGDPYVFGRGGEEQAALMAEGIPVEVVPGITAALGCASIGLPITQRGQNRAFTILTGASEHGIADHDWHALAKPGASFAIYMGVNAAGDISARLLDSGILPETPVTIVENGTLPTERVFTTTIGSLWETLTLKGVYGPAIIYVGLARPKASADIVPFPVRQDISETMLRAAS
jgi:uroporphyrin-III C-methyltransferase/precorrin-2 dehydrogenase/sirohydrochlorin ferrochelatase